MCLCRGSASFLFNQGESGRGKLRKIVILIRGFVITVVKLPEKGTTSVLNCSIFKIEDKAKKKYL